jgi:hypothetical protein
MIFNKQQAVADVLQQLANQGFIITLNGDRSIYEIAKTILSAITNSEIEEMENQLCLNCREAMREDGHVLCSDCAAPYALVNDERSESESAEYRTAH